MVFKEGNKVMLIKPTDEQIQKHGIINNDREQIHRLLGEVLTIKNVENNLYHLLDRHGNETGLRVPSSLMNSVRMRAPKNSPYLIKIRAKEDADDNLKVTFQLSRRLESTLRKMCIKDVTLSNYNGFEYTRYRIKREVASRSNTHDQLLFNKELMDNRKTTITVGGYEIYDDLCNSIKSFLESQATSRPKNSVIKMVRHNG